MAVQEPIVSGESPRDDSLRLGDRAATRERIVRNISALGVGQVLTWACTATLAILLPRYLGDEALGKVVTATSLTSLFGLLAGLGSGMYITKAVASHAARARDDVLNALAMRVPLVFVAVVATLIAASLLEYDALTRQLIYISCFGIAIGAVSGIVTSALQGMQQMRTVAAAGVLVKALTVALAVAAVIGDLGLVAIVLGALIASAVGLVWTLRALIRRGGIGGRLDLSRWRPILLGSLPFFVWQAALVIYGQVDIVLLSVLSHDAAIGWYAAAYRIIGISSFVPTIVGVALFPALAWAAQHDPQEFGQLARRSMQIVLLLTVPLALGTMATAGAIVEFMQLPSGFENSVPLMMILALHMPMVGATMVIGNVLNARDRQRFWSIVAVLAACLNPAMDWWLIPHFETTTANGAIGSAIGTVVTEAFMLGAGVWLARNLAFDRGSLGFGLKCVLSGLVMVAAVLAAGSLPLPVLVVIGSLVYVASSLLIGTVTTNDLRLLRAFILKRASPG